MTPANLAFLLLALATTFEGLIATAFTCAAVASLARATLDRDEIQQRASLTTLIVSVPAALILAAATTFLGHLGQVW